MYGEAIIPYLAKGPSIITNMNLSIAQALRVDASTCVAFVGAGGKTTALFRLARQLPSPVIVTATSHLGAWQFGLADQHIIADSLPSLEQLEHGLNGIILVTGEIEVDRSKPINENLLNWLHQFCSYHSIPLLIEADGSRQKPLKAWADHEPAIPGFVNLVVQVVGLTALGKPLNDEHVHRPELFSKIGGLQKAEIIAPEELTRALTDPVGGLKNIPPKARRVVLLNQADTNELQSMANAMVKPLLSAFASVIIASLEREEIYAVHEHVAGVVLAAGESKRYGQTKQLLDWRGEPFVRSVAKTALEAGLSPVVVVTGAHAEKIESAVKDLNVQVAYNEEWNSGQGGSIKSGAKVLQDSAVGGAIFLLVDQPQVTTSILRALVEKHTEALYPVIAPLVMDQRANPVLFDRSTFPDLLSIEGDVGGRAIFHKHRVEYLPWHDDRLLLDVDTPEMYQRLISDETL
jgi:molybdenum cofactor cytidylyltransferase